ncbi:unnamed protein product [Clonostachys chloroleuca]|uniref:Uncharacterized protein n=1 Tax=Clonostachys chloroleuca TaxID=1926264 RepID=A0AA35M0P4_9HYPO|nr:unnamed protein product [Clonostachys chloroleuca]
MVSATGKRDLIVKEFRKDMHAMKRSGMFNAIDLFGLLDGECTLVNLFLILLNTESLSVRLLCFVFLAFPAKMYCKVVNRINGLRLTYNAYFNLNKLAEEPFAFVSLALHVKRTSKSLHDTKTFLMIPAVLGIFENLFKEVSRFIHSFLIVILLAIQEQVSKSTHRLDCVVMFISQCPPLCRKHPSEHPLGFVVPAKATQGTR